MKAGRWLAAAGFALSLLGVAGSAHADPGCGYRADRCDRSAGYREFHSCRDGEQTRYFEREYPATVHRVVWVRAYRRPTWRRTYAYHRASWRWAAQRGRYREGGWHCARYR